MKPYLFILLVFAISCTSSTANQESKSDSTTTSTDSLAEEVTSEEVVADVQSEESESSEQTGTELDSVWLREFANRPLGSDPYGNLSSALHGKGATFSGDSINGDSDVAFGNSRIKIYTAEAYGSIVCSANIDAPEISMEKGVNVGMSREDFLSISGIPASFFKAADDGQEYFEFYLGYDDNTSTTTVFWVNKESLIRVEYTFSPCIIYD